MTKAERTAERHENIEMLSELLAISRHYDELSKSCDEKKEEILRLDGEIAKPRPRKIKTWLLIFLSVITLGIYLIVFLILDNIDKKKWKKSIETLKTEREKAEKIYEEACAEIAAYDEDTFKPYIESLLPDRFTEKYIRDSYAIAYILDLLKNLCADTIREAILLFEEQIYRARIEEHMLQIVKNTAAFLVKPSLTSADSSKRKMV